MKSRLILLQIYVLLIAVTIIQQNAFSQLPMNAPQVAWRQIDWDRDNLMGEEVTQETSGEDWWYSGKAVYDAGNNLIGYIACGYTNNLVTQANVVPYKIVTRPSNNCDVNAPYSFTIADNAPNNFARGDCSDREIPSVRRKGENQGQMTFMDIYGNMKWCTPVFRGEMIEVIQVSDGFIGIGETYGIRTTNGFVQPYELLLGSQQIFTTSPCINGSTKHLAIVKLDFDGNEVWSSIYGSKDLDADLFNMFWASQASGWDIIKSSNGNLIASGWAKNPLTGRQNIFLIEVNASTGDLVRKSLLSFDVYNHETTPRQATGWIGTEIVEIGTSGNYVVAGRVEFAESPDEFTNAFLLRVDNTLQPNPGDWDINPIRFYDVNPMSTDADLVNKRNGNITDILYNSTNTTLYVPVVQHCDQCSYAQYGSKGELVVHRIHATTGNPLGSTPFGVVAAFDLRAGITETQDGNIAVVSSKKNFGQYTYTEQSFIDVIDSSGLNIIVETTDGTTDCKAAMQAAGLSFYDSDAFIAKMTPGGSVLWSTIFDADANPNRRRRPYPYDIKRQECLYRIISTPENGLVIFGNASHNFDDYYSVKLFSDCQSNFVLGVNDIFDNVDNVYDVGINEIWSTDKIVKGIVRIASDRKLTIDAATIEFEDGARIGIQTKIEVMAGGKLIIKNGAILTSLQSCDQAMWGGIEVEGQPTKPQSIDPITGQNYQGIVVISSNSQVNRAYNAVSTTARDNNGAIEWSKTGGGIVQVTNSSFTDNARAFEFRGYSYYNTNPPFNPVSDKSYILLNNFNTTEAFGNLGYQRDPYTFISMNSTRNIRIEGNTFTNFRSPVFGIDISPDKWGSGIVSIDAGYRVIPRCTTGITPVGVPCLGTVPNTFNNLFQGIYISHGASNQVVTVDGNIFNRNLYGVRVAGDQFTTIIRNTFNIDDYPYPDFSESFGIYADAAYGMRSEGNVMNGLGLLGIGRSIGTFVKNSDNITGGMSDYRNDYINLETGSQGEGFNFIYKIDCNRYYGDNTLTTAGIFIADGEMGNLGVCNLPGDLDPLKPEANEFYGTCNNSSKFQIFTNPFVVGFDNDQWRYNSYKDDALANPLIGTNFNTFCLSSNMQGIPCTPVVLYDRTNACPALYTNSWALNKEIAFGNYRSTIDFINADKAKIDGGNTKGVLIFIAGNHSAGQLKNYLIARSPYLSDEVLIAAIHKNLPPGHIKQILIANSSLSKKVLAVVNEASLPSGIHNLVMVAQNGEGAMKDLLNKIHQEEAVKILATSEIVYNYLDTNQVDSAILFLQNSGIPNALCALVPLMYNRKPMPSDTATPQPIDTVIIKRMLDTIEVAAHKMLLDPETARKGEDLKDFCSFHTTLLRIQSREGGYFTMSQTERDALQALADGNSLVASSAQGILQFVNQTSIYKGALDYNFNQPHSLAVNQPVINETEDEINMNVYPNPAMEGFSIQLSRIPDITEVGTLTIYDMNGRLLHTKILGNGQDYDWISTEAWPTGLYVVSVNINDKYLLYKKVIVAK